MRLDTMFQDDSNVVSVHRLMYHRHIDKYVYCYLGESQSQPSACNKLSICRHVL